MHTFVDWLTVSPRQAAALAGSQDEFWGLWREAHSARCSSAHSELAAHVPPCENITHAAWQNQYLLGAGLIHSSAVGSTLQSSANEDFCAH